MLDCLELSFLAMGEQGIERFKPLVGSAAKQLSTRSGQIHHLSSPLYIQRVRGRKTIAWGSCTTGPVAAESGHATGSGYRLLSLDWKRAGTVCSGGVPSGLHDNVSVLCNFGVGSVVCHRFAYETRRVVLFHELEGLAHHAAQGLGMLLAEVLCVLPIVVAFVGADERERPKIVALR
jgi:hypothetical protein